MLWLYYFHSRFSFTGFSHKITVAIFLGFGYVVYMVKQNVES